MPYRAPCDDYEFILKHIVGFARVQATSRFSAADSESSSAIILEAGRMCEDIIAPLQRKGDLDPARLENGVVRTAEGFAEGYGAIGDGGWIGMSGPEAYGGMGLPISLASVVNEMLSSACLSIQLSPLMSQGQIEALDHHASESLKALYLPKLISGEWMATMNLTEPHAGSDVGALKTRAEPQEDGTYKISGQKIYISWGDNDFGRNVSHLVLARLPDGVPGTKGISLFLVPKYIPDGNGEPGVANSLKVVSVEHKMGLHGSPTCVMQYEEATGWLVGEPHGGMAAMFTMMNNARLGVGGQGVGVAEGAYQHALSYALERTQGRTSKGVVGPIADHADVRRMLMTMKAEIFAARSILLACAGAIDMETATAEPGWSARAALLTPIAKTFGAETGIRVSETGVQVFGGMGVIEETGAAQYSRDVRVAAIYEGTTGIQAMDLVARKMMDGGEAAASLFDEIEEQAENARARFPELAEAVWQASETLREATEWLVSQNDMNDRFAGAVPYLQAFGRVLGAHFHLSAAVASSSGPREALARFYIKRLLPEHVGLLAHAMCGQEGLFDIDHEGLAA